MRSRGDISLKLSQVRPLMTSFYRWVNQHLLSRSVSGVSLNFIVFVELKIPEWCTLVELWHHNITQPPIFLPLDGRIDIWLNILVFYRNQKRQNMINNTKRKNGKMFNKTRSKLTMIFGIDMFKVNNRNTRTRCEIIWTPLASF